jgi:hypothetical protein
MVALGAWDIPGVCDMAATTASSCVGQSTTPR